MIRAKNLTKLYSTGKAEVLALDSLNFTLPNTGLVFIIGKSGSGKSTLINMIGGLDDITSGEVLVDNLSIGKLSQRKLDEYHNNYLGIIYQNYNLFDDETVLENVQISNRIANNKKTVEQIEELLNSLELKDKSNTLVSNLSGGQKQRVAIARALVKEPKLILADEPTGNLDNKTTKNIFNLLKKISKDKLVLVITHDMKSALNYADRIIGLSDGKIVQDLSKHVKGGTSVTYVELDDTQEIEDEKIKELNEAIKKTKYRLIRKGEHFAPTENVEAEDPVKTEEVKQKITFRRALITGLKSSKRNAFSLIATSLINMLIIGLLSLSTSFINFDGKSAISDVSETYEINNLIIRKSYSDTGRIVDMNKKYFVEIEDNDEQLFDRLGLEGKRYPLYNVNLLYHSDGHYQDCFMQNNNIDYDNFYPTNGYGVIQCDKEYLTKIFKGEPQVLAGSLYDIDKGILLIVPDFVADTLLFYNSNLKSKDPNDPYQNMLNIKLNGRFNIGAVIKTDYKEKYKDFMDVLNRMVLEPQNATEIRKAILQSDLFINFTNDVQSYLNYGYTLNPNYITEYKKAQTVAYFGNALYSVGDDENHKYELPIDNYDIYDSKTLEGNQIRLTTTSYNQLFNMSITSADDPSFVEKEFTVYNYSYADKYKDKIKHQMTFRVVGIDDTKSQSNMYISKEAGVELRDWNHIQYGWTYTEPNDCYKIYSELSPYYFYNSIVCFKAVYDTIDIITIFAEVFSVLLYILLGVLALVIVLHNVRVIKKEQYRLGVYKSLGYSNLYLTVVMLVSNVVMLIGTFAFSLAFSFGTSFLVNKLLQFGFATYASNRIYYKITLLVFKLAHTALFNLITMGIIFVSSFVPLLVIRKIKPSKIIRNAE